MKNKLPVVYFERRYQWLFAIINMYLVIGAFGITRCSPLPRSPLLIVIYSENSHKFKYLGTATTDSSDFSLI